VRGWDLQVGLDGGGPVFLRIARALADDVRAGRLEPGVRLPGSRTLARSLGVHRNTVLAAYGELEAEGWIATSPARGTFVASDLPARRRAAPRGRAPPPPRRAGFDLPPARAPDLPAPPPRGALPLLGGVPDLRLVPAAALARAWRRALRRREHLGYGDPRGHPRLRAALSGMLAATRGLRPDPAALVVTRGSQMALALASRALLREGDRVAVEALGYRPAWEALRAAGAALVPVPVDAGGLDVSALAEAHRRAPLRAVYLTPHHQYPTTATLAPARRLALLDLAARERVAVLEDDYDAEFHYDGRPRLPLASADRAGVVVYVGTLSKVLAPGLRVGFAVAPAPLVERMVALRVHLDRQGDLVLEAALAELIEDGELQRHLWRTRRAYAARRDALADLLRAELGGALAFERPAGGLALWCRASGGRDPERWAERAERRGVLVRAGRAFAFDGRAIPYLRLGFAALDERELREAVRRLAAAAEG
jgi:GntR family transcriptional regulator/MocR family aminotransferase